MKYTNVPFVDKPVSRIVLGGSGRLFASGGDVTEVMDAALECGINCVDTAREYGNSEAAIGRYFLKRGRRDDFVLISKCCHPTLAFVQRVNPAAAASDLMRSLDTLGTDHIDIYFLHRDDPSVDVGPIAEMMHRFHEEGKIKAFGGSNWSTKRIMELNAYAAEHGLTGFTVSSPHYSLGRQQHDPWGNGCKTITGRNNASQRAYYKETGMPIFCWAALCGGMFSGAVKSSDPLRMMHFLGFNSTWGYWSKDNFERLRRCEQLAKEKGVSVPQIVLSWILNSDMNTLAIVGCNTPERVFDNARAADLELSKKDLIWLSAVE